MSRARTSGREAESGVTESRAQKSTRRRKQRHPRQLSSLHRDDNRGSESAVWTNTVFSNLMETLVSPEAGGRFLHGIETGVIKQHEKVNQAATASASTAGSKPMRATDSASTVDWKGVPPAKAAWPTVFVPGVKVKGKVRTQHHAMRKRASTKELSSPRDSHQQIVMRGGGDQRAYPADRLSYEGPAPLRRRFSSIRETMDIKDDLKSSLSDDSQGDFALAEGKREEKRVVIKLSKDPGRKLTTNKSDSESCGNRLGRLYAPSGRLRHRRRSTSGFWCESDIDEMETSVIPSVSEGTSYRSYETESSDDDEMLDHSVAEHYFNSAELAKGTEMVFKPADKDLAPPLGGSTRAQTIFNDRDAPDGGVWLGLAVDHIYRCYTIVGASEICFGFNGDTRGVGGPRIFNKTISTDKAKQQDLQYSKLGDSPFYNPHSRYSPRMAKPPQSVSAPPSRSGRDPRTVGRGSQIMGLAASTDGGRLRPTVFVNNKTTGYDPNKNEDDSDGDDQFASIVSSDDESLSFGDVVKLRSEQQLQGIITNNHLPRPACEVLTGIRDRWMEYYIRLSAVSRSHLSLNLNAKSGKMKMGSQLSVGTVRHVSTKCVSNMTDDIIRNSSARPHNDLNEGATRVERNDMLIYNKRDYGVDRFIQVARKTPTFQDLCSTMRILTANANVDAGRMRGGDVPERQWRCRLWRLLRGVVVNMFFGSATCDKKIIQPYFCSSAVLTICPLKFDLLVIAPPVDTHKTKHTAWSRGDFSTVGPESSQAETLLASLHLNARRLLSHGHYLGLIDVALEKDIPYVFKLPVDKIKIMGTERRMNDVWLTRSAERGIVSLNHAVDYVPIPRSNDLLEYLISSLNRCNSTPVRMCNEGPLKFNRPRDEGNCEALLHIEFNNMSTLSLHVCNGQNAISVPSILTNTPGSSTENFYRSNKDIKKKKLTATTREVAGQFEVVEPDEQRITNPLNQIGFVRDLMLEAVLLSGTLQSDMNGTWSPEIRLGKDLTPRKTVVEEPKKAKAATKRLWRRRFKG